MGKARRPPKPKARVPRPFLEGEERETLCEDGVTKAKWRYSRGRWKRIDEAFLEAPLPVVELPREDEEAETLCVDRVRKARWKFKKGRWKRIDKELIEAPTPTAPYCCDLLQAVVYLNYCLPFWAGIPCLSPG